MSDCLQRNRKKVQKLQKRSLVILRSVILSRKIQSGLLFNRLVQSDQITEKMDLFFVKKHFTKKHLKMKIYEKIKI